ncbi:MAG: AEC family transporter [Saccharofermentanales bacterium]|jgi:predicted permease|nr:AEC family transporter [Clostridiaceae bacterium]
MENIIFSFQTVFPLLAYMLVGLLVKRTKIANEHALSQMNNIVFKILLPMSIFRNIVTADMSGVNMGPVLIYAVVAVFIIFLLAWAVFARWETDPKKKSVMIQNAFRSNFVLFGLPLTQMILGGKGSGVTEILIAVVVPFFNVLAVFILQYYNESKMNFKSLIIGMLTNPLIVSSLIALLYKFTLKSIPVFLETTVNGLASAATPLALIVLGSRFEFKESVRYKKYLVAGVLSRLIIVPVIFLGGAILLGFRGETLIAYIAVSASPVAVASYAMSQGANADYKLAGQLLVYNSVFCSVSLFFIIYLLRSFQFI